MGLDREDTNGKQVRKLEYAMIERAESVKRQTF